MTDRSIDTVFAEIVKQFDGAPPEKRRSPKRVLEDLVGQRVTAEGTLARQDAFAIAKATGWSIRSVWRTREWMTKPPPEPVPTGAPEPEGSFLDRIEEHGPKGFVFDELALALLYMCGGNRARFRREIESAGYLMPSAATLSRRWKELPAQLRDGATAGHRNRFKNLLYVRKAPAESVNEVWQVDDFDLDIRVLTTNRNDNDDAIDATEDRPGDWVAVRPHLTLLMDERSRFITAWMLLDRAPTTADTGALFADAFEVRDADIGDGLIGGRCSTVICDNASVFRSLGAEEMFTGAGVAVRPAPAYSPISKGIVERTGQTIQAELITGLSGVVSTAQRRNLQSLFDTDPSTWLEYTQLERRCAEVIEDYNYRRPHEGINGKTPASIYLAENTAPRRVDGEILAEWYLPISHSNGIRKVQNTGVYCLGAYWLAPELSEFIGTEVQVRRLHHRLDRVAIFDMDDRFIALAVPSGRVDEDLARALVDERITTEAAINRYAARAREAMEIRAANNGGDTSFVDAGIEAMRRRAERNETGGGRAEEPKVQAPPGRKGRKAPSGTKPTRRVPKVNRSTSGLAPPNAGETTDLGLAEEAAAKALKRKAAADDEAKGED